MNLLKSHFYVLEKCTLSIQHFWKLMPEYKTIQTVQY